MAKSNVTRSWGLINGAFIMAALPVMQAHAQTALPAPEHAQVGLEEIVVTARKREETLQKVPASITALSTEQIRRNDISSLEKLAASQPSILIGRASSGSGAQIGIRGITSSAQSIGIEQSVATVLDGVYYGQGAVINEGFMDLAGMEVIKGPQALFYGKNATAGVISITTADPGPDLEIIAKGGYEFNARQIYAEGVISSPLSDTLGIRVAVRAAKMYGTYFKNGSPRRNASLVDIGAGGVVRNFIVDPASSDQPGTRELMGRVTLKWEPSDRLAATIKASRTISKNNAPGYNFVTFACPNGVQQANPSVACRRHFVMYGNNMPESLAATFPLGRDGGLYSSYKAYAVTGTLDYELVDGLTLTWINNYQNNHVKQLGDFQYESPEGAAFWASMDMRWYAYSSEARVLTKLDGPINVLAGLYFQSTKRGYNEYHSLSGAPNSGIMDSAAERPALTLEKDSKTRGKTYSAYGQMILNPVDNVEITGGVRYTHETKDSYFVQPFVMAPLQVAFIQGQTIAGKQTFNRWSPEATITWTPVPDVSIYGAFKTGYKSGGFSNSSAYAASTVPENLFFAPETASGFEGGVKSTLLNNTFRLNLGIYSYKYKNLQVDFINPVALAFITTNAGSARSKGIEFEATWAPIEGLTVHGIYNYNKANYLNFLGPCYTGQSAAKGCTLTGPGGAPFQNLSGAPLLNAPRNVASAGFTYQTALSSNFEFGISGNAKYSSRYSVSAFAQPAARQKSYTSIDASMRIGAVDKRWELALIGKNLTNKFILAGSLDTPATGLSGGLADTTGYVNNPRTVQLELTYRM